MSQTAIEQERDPAPPLRFAPPPPPPSPVSATESMEDVERRAIICRLVSGSQFFAGAMFDDTGRIVITLDGTGSLQLASDAINDLVGSWVGPSLRWG